MGAQSETFIHIVLVTLMLLTGDNNVVRFIAFITKTKKRKEKKNCLEINQAKKAGHLERNKSLSVFIWDSERSKEQKSKKY